MEKEILEGNKLMAEFMGAEWKKDDYGDFGYFFPDYSHRPTAETALKYHTSWDWIMPVVEKIGTKPICFNVNINTFDGCGIYDDNYKRTAQGVTMSGGINGTLIQSTWKCVVQFINWYNKQVK